MSGIFFSCYKFAYHFFLEQRTFTTLKDIPFAMDVPTNNINNHPPGQILSNSTTPNRIVNNVSSATKPKSLF
jgi:hypothetical protein